MPAALVARHEPVGEFRADPRRGKIDDLNDRAGRHSLPSACAMMSAERSSAPTMGASFESNFTRAGIVKDLRLAVVTAIREPMRKHRHAGIRPAFLRRARHHRQRCPGAMTRYPSPINPRYRKQRRAIRPPALLELRQKAPQAVNFAQLTPQPTRQQASRQLEAR